MATYLIQIPANYRARVGGNSSVSVDASSPQEARTQVVQAGIPAALIGNPTEITGNITSGSLPPNISEYALPSFGPDRNPLLRDDRVIGANNPTRPMGMENRNFGLPGGEQVSGNPFAANINRPPTMAEIQAAMPYQLGTPSSPFYQPPSYQRMTPEDFAGIRANANQPLFDEQSFLGGSFNTGGRLPEEVAGISSGPTTGLGPSYDPTGGSFATDADEIARMEAAARKQLADRRAQELTTATSVTDPEVLGSTTSTEPLEDIDALEAEDFARRERERLSDIRKQLAAAEIVTDKGDGDKGDEPVDMPANLPLFWKERYNEYLGLPGGQQQAILDNQLQNYIDLNDWQISTGGATGEEGGGVSGAAGADLTLQELEELATGGGAGGGFTFQPGAFTGAGNIPQPMNFEGFPVTGLQDMMNIFYSDPSQYIVEQDIIGTTGYDENGNPIEGIIGSQQSLSPAAQAALQAFSTQRGAESADLASRFGTSTPFGAIAGLGGTSADAVGLAELQARAGVSNPYAALGTGSGIGDIGTILRGGLSTQEQSDLAGLQARGGLTVEQQSALAGMQARGGLTAEEQLTLSGLQARGGLSAQERLAEQRLGILPSLFQATPQALGGLSRVLGGEEALRGALTPFFGGVPAQQQPFAPAPAMRQGQPTPVNLFSSGTAQQPTFGNLLSSQISQQPTPSFRPTLGDYQGAGMFEQGGLQAQAGMAGQELPKFLGEVSPQGTSTARGGLGATTTGRFTY
tara:strand:- start:487 stop:2727 length:2241 start_codon:yes stop_codon:yes gene_type:complete